MFTLFGTEEIFEKSKKEIRDEKDLKHVDESEKRYNELERKFKAREPITEAEYMQCGEDIMNDKEIFEDLTGRVEDKVVEMCGVFPQELIERMIPTFIEDLIGASIALGERKGVLKIIGYNLGFLNDKE